MRSRIDCQWSRVSQVVAASPPLSTITSYGYFVQTAGRGIRSGKGGAEVAPTGYPAVAPPSIAMVTPVM
ncbi:MAG: hypothetical protein ACRED5_14695 [Propylenella sp.]